MKKNNISFQKIKSFEQLDLEKAKLKNQMNYEKELMALGYDRLLDNFQARVVDEVKEVTQSALSDFLIRLITGRK